MINYVLQHIVFLCYRRGDYKYEEVIKYALPIVFPCKHGSLRCSLLL
jgi:hypothetical protein